MPKLQTKHLQQIVGYLKALIQQKFAIIELTTTSTSIPSNWVASLRRKAATLNTRWWLIFRESAQFSDTLPVPKLD